MRFWILLLALSPAFGQAGLYQFGIDQDNLRGAPDFSFLNHPLDAGDRLVAHDGHFYRVGDDSRVRLFGVNLAFGANFPAAPDAVRIARRLRRLGVNLVRLHHMDTSPDANPDNAGSLLMRAPYPTLNPVSAGRLRAFLDALKAAGIYADLNLHVGYQFRSDNKTAYMIEPDLIGLQAQYAAAVIDTLQLNDDPVLGVVEINNESSLLDSWQRGNLDYNAELARRWNEFLAARYESTDALIAAWGDTQPDGPDMLAGLRWIPEIHAPAKASFETMDDATIRITVAQGGAPAIFKRVGFSVAAGAPYIAEVEIRAELPGGQSRNVYWDVKQDVSPWSTETGRNIAITNQWTKFTMAFNAPFVMDGIGRFGLSVENVTGALYVRDATVKQAGRRGLAPGETLEDGNISLVTSTEIATISRANDFLLFLAERDRAYLDQILGAVRDHAGPLVPVTGSQMGYGGLLNLDSHADLDYLDNHFYVDHYAFPNVAWDGRDWSIRDDSAIGSGLSAFRNMAAAREWGRPYTVSEYNQPWPNTHGAEIDPVLAAFAAFQDWDAIVHFAYSHARNWDDGVPNGFNINGDWTKFPNIGQAAWLFRTGAIQAAATQMAIPVSQELRLQAGREKADGNIASFLGRVQGYDPANALLYAVGLNPQPALLPTGPDNPPDFELADKLFLIHADQAAGIFGFVGTQTVTSGPLDLELAQGARGFGAVLLTALDGQPISTSGQLLLSIPGYALRSQPGADPPREQRLVNYGSSTNTWTLEKEPNYPNKPSGDLNGGVGPTWMERIESYVTLRTSAGAIAVYPLDGAGARLDPLADVVAVPGGFRIHLQAPGESPSPWYEIIAR